MLARLEHRGPDDRGTYESAGVRLGAHRLAIIDVEHGHQPTQNESRSVTAVLNGELYNHRELRDLLGARGHKFRSHTDTELLPHLYEEFGADFCVLLRGMYSIAIWDEERSRLLLVRDRIGEKPLFYTTNSNEGIAFSSELRSLLASGEATRSVDSEALGTYLVLGYVPAPATIVNGVHKLPPAHRLIAEGGEITVERYWSAAGGDPAYAVSRRGAARELRELLSDSVARQMVADVPVGALLSGGVDSASIVAMMCRSAGADRVRTFTVGFAHSPYDERPAARAVAQALGTEHTEILVDPPDTAGLSAMVRHLDEPVADQAALPSYLISREARKHVSVVLSGEGADELFAGYPRYKWTRRAASAQRVPQAVRQALLHPGRRVAGLTGNPRRADLLLGFDDDFARYTSWVGVFPSSCLTRLLGAERGALAIQGVAGHAARTYTALAGTDPVEHGMLMDLTYWLPDNLMVKADRMSMAWSLEARSPFLDHHMVQFATSLPAEFRLKGAQTKALLREAMKEMLPPDTLGRRKQAFRVPVEQWLGGHFTATLNELLSPGGCLGSVLEPSEVERIRAGSGPDRARQMWSLGVLELWCREVLDA